MDRIAQTQKGYNGVKMADLLLFGFVTVAMFLLYPSITLYLGIYGCFGHICTFFISCFCRLPFADPFNRLFSKIIQKEFQRYGNSSKNAYDSENYRLYYYCRQSGKSQIKSVL